MRPKTIADLQKITDEEKAELLRNVPDLAGIVNEQAHARGNRMRPTKAAFDKMQPERTYCKTCGGRGFTDTKGRHVGGLHPSAHKSCVVRQYYDVVGTLEWREDMSPALWMTYQVGHFMHEMYQDLLLSSEHVGGAVEVPVTYPDWFVMEGHADGVLEVDGFRFLLELKSASEKSYANTRSASSEHIVQANVYAHVLDVPMVCVMYGNKEDFSQMKQFWSFYNPSTLTDYVDTVITPIGEALINGGLPPHTPKDWQCRACGYAHGCALLRKTKGF